MSSLSSSSTLEQVADAIDDNVSYEEDADVSKARALLTAIRIYRRRLPASAGDGSHTSAYNHATLEALEADARAWLAQNGGNVSPSTASAAGGPYGPVIHTPEGFR